MVDTVNVKFTADNSDLNKKADQSEKKVLGISKGVAGVAVAATAAFAAIGKGIQVAVREAAKFEDIQTQFKVLTGDIDTANDALKQIADFSAGTPFLFEDVAAAGRTFLSFGFDVENVTQLLQEVGDVAAASGSDFKELALIYGQVAAAGKLTGERLDQLQQRGIAIGPALAKALKQPEEAIKDLVSAGRVTKDVFQQAFATLSQEGGPAFGGLASLSGTLNGKLSTLEDNFAKFSRTIGGFFVPAIKDAVDGITDFIKGVNELITLDPNQVRAGEIVDELTLLQNKLAELEESGKNQSFFDKIFGNEKLRQEFIDKTKAQIDELNAELDAIVAAQKKREKEATGAEAVSASAQKRLDAEREYLIARGNLIDSFTQERNENEATTEEERLEILQGNIQREAELKELQKIDQLASQKKFEEALDAIRQKSVKDEAKALDAKLKRTKLSEEERRAILQSSFSQIATLQSSSNKALVAVGKAAGIANVIISTNVGAAKALELGPIIGPPLAAAIVAAGAVNAANIAGVKGFADGGVIGGINGATAGGDNAIATVRTGEMVLNAQQQEELFNAINSGQLGNGEGGAFDVNVNINAGEFTDAFEVEVVRRDRENRTPIQVRR